MSHASDPGSAARRRMVLPSGRCVDVVRLEARLGHDADEMQRDLQRLTAANMGAELERFMVALAGDHILPEDF